MTIKNGLKQAVLWAGLISIIGGGMKACNNAWNNKSISNPGYKTESHALGLFGHVEFTTYSDGSHDVKIYPQLSHRYYSSQLNQDLDGDDKVDRIRQNGSEVRMNSLKKILTREYDYNTNKELFDEADKQLQNLILKYSLKR